MSEALPRAAAQQGSVLAYFPYTTIDYFERLGRNEDGDSIAASSPYLPRDILCSRTKWFMAPNFIPNLARSVLSLPRHIIYVHDRHEAMRSRE